MLRLARELTLLAIPIIVMVGLIPIVQSDIVLTAIYAGAIIAFLTIRRDKLDVVFLLFGIIVLTISEYFFIATGVETFNRQSLFGVMPLWLPLLWGYAFIAMRRAIMAIESYFG